MILFDWDKLKGPLRDPQAETTPSGLVGGQLCVDLVVLCKQRMVTRGII